LVMGGQKRMSLSLYTLVKKEWAYTPNEISNACDHDSGGSQWVREPELANLGLRGWIRRWRRRSRGWGLLSSDISPASYQDMVNDYMAYSIC